MDKLDLPSEDISIKQYQPLLAGDVKLGFRVYLDDVRQLERAHEWQEADIICINYPYLKKWNQENKNIRDLIKPSQDLFITLTANSKVVDEESILKLGQNLAEVAPLTLVTDFGYCHGGDPDYLIDCHVDAYLEHLIKLVEVIDKLNEEISIVPVVKALSEDHYRKTKRVFNKLGFSTAAIYLSQIFGGKSGNPSNQIEPLIIKIITKLELTGILTMGLGSPGYLGALPDQIYVTCYFKQWFNSTDEEDLTELQRRALKDDSHQAKLNDSTFFERGEGD